MQLFEDVLSIQAVRNRRSDEIGGWTTRFKNGDLSVRSYRKKYHRWQTEERILANRVTFIYDVGYDAGCFDQNKEW
jgi:hypothetical protein